MPVLTPKIVFRRYVTDGVPDSGEWDPRKDEIIQLLELLFGVAVSGAYTVQTKSALDAITPDDEEMGGIVLNDPDPTKNGYYYRSAGAWVKGRGFPDTFTVFTQTGGTANALQLSAAGGVNPGDVVAAFLVPTSSNTGPATISISGAAAVPLVSAAGSPLAAGELVGGKATIIAYIAGQWRVILAFSQFSFRGAWDDEATYVGDDILQNEGSLWLALRSNTGVEPVEGADWTLFLPGVTVADGSITDAKLATSLKNKIMGVAANRTVLANMFGADYQAVDLMEGQRKGLFYWDGSDLSAVVTADPQQGIYVPPASDTTGSSGAWVRQYGVYLRPQWFGAEGDGSTDDSDAIEAVILLGPPVDWGDQTYVLTREVLGTAAAPVNWKAAGAKIVYASSAITGNSIYLQCPGLAVEIKGVLEFDGQMKCFDGPHFRNNTDTYVDFVASDLAVSNIYRASLDFDGGCGITVEGSWRNVAFTRPKIRNVVMANGAWVAGLRSISGILVKATSSSPERAPQKLTIIDPDIEDIKSEDPAQSTDMDGIKAFSAEDTSSIPHESRMVVIGGKFKNCWGRSIKSQMSYGRVSGSQFIRTAGASGKVGQEEISFQVGAGDVEGIECFYNGYFPGCVVGFSGTRYADTQPVPGGSLKGLKLTINGGAANVLDSIVGVNSRSNTRMAIVINDVQHNGGTSQVRNLLYGILSVSSIISISSVMCRVNEALVRLSVSAGSTQLCVDKAWNFGPSVPLLTGSAGVTVATGIGVINLS